ncbi:MULTISPECIES: lysozyme inhibitor LprI family protein [unclassified Achromobacter]|jgi:uncharacterized protein YecT (DUF1311 family)|uniref:lysozyme inhibitor LprI family protein n=1 Tax=unclassified Achromobacter TaxID=2626865 RepID=UPI00069D5917|nr:MULTISPECIES: lysozyme inhibitor LprI family protein [unclassified Achromobacter]KOF52637.1 urease-associated protein [Achromobacter sp. DMS1]
MRHATAGVVLAGLALAAGAQAQGLNCADPATQTDMNLCADQAYRKSDAELNAAYKSLVARLHKDRQAESRLNTAQRAWLAFRDAECAFAAGGVQEGSAYPMAQARCLDRLTRDRTRALRDYLECGAGDLDCPAPAD